MIQDFGFAEPINRKELVSKAGTPAIMLLKCSIISFIQRKGMCFQWVSYYFRCLEVTLHLKVY